MESAAKERKYDFFAGRLIIEMTLKLGGDVPTS
jgi:hypothetical protein